MSKFIVDGPTKLSGTVKIGGSKNAVLPILAATILATKSVTLTNVPDIRDVAVMLEILKCFGMRITGTSGTVRLDPTGVKAGVVPDELAHKLRASILILGAALGRFGHVKIAYPGGDIIGKRPLDTHFDSLRALGAEVMLHDGHYEVRVKQLKGSELFLEEASVTATENVLLAASVARGRTVVQNAASELHVSDLARFLTTLGAKITGAGTNHIVIDGVAGLGGGKHEIRPDEIETGTLMIAAALTGGTVTLTGADPGHFAMIPIKLRQAGINFKVNGEKITVKPPHKLKPTNLQINTWPGFPTDLQPPFTVLMTQAQGASLIHDWMYEGRFFYTDKLVAMGANITMSDPHRITVTGQTALVGKELESPDIRAGITMLVAALIAEGRTVIEHAEWIDRGYERIDQRLQSLGAKIRRVE